MANLIVYVNGEGRVVGAVRADPIQTESGTLQAQVPERALKVARARSPEKARVELTFHEIEVPDNLVDGGSLEDLNREVERRVASQRAEE
jgi:hypothetical protein